MLHTKPADLVIERKGDEDDAAGIVTKAIGELTATVDARLKEVESKSDTSAIVARLEKLETKANRPGASGGVENKGGENTAETKAFGTYLRQGAVNPDEIKALNKATDTAGGYLVPDTFVAELLKNVVQFSPVRQYARVMSISSADVTMPKRTGTMTAAWVSETGNRSSTQQTYGQVTLTPHEAACYVDVSNQLLEDSAIDIANEISLDGAEEFGRLEGAAFVNGDGTGKPKGILAETLEEIVTAGAAAITADELINAFYDLPAFYRANATWGMNSGTLSAVRKLKTASGDYLWQPSLQAGQPELLLGRPVAELPDMEDIGAGNTPIVFGDFNQGYRIVDRVQLALLRDPFKLAENGQTRFHLRRRVGGGVVKAEALRKITNAAS